MNNRHARFDHIIITLLTLLFRSGPVQLSHPLLLSFGRTVICTNYEEPYCRICHRNSIIIATQSDRMPIRGLLRSMRSGKAGSSSSLCGKVAYRTNVVCCRRRRRLVGKQWMAGLDDMNGWASANNCSFGQTTETRSAIQRLLNCGLAGDEMRHTTWAVDCVWWGSC